MVVFEDEVRQASHETYVMTDDGSYGEQGLVTFKLNGLIDAGRKIDFVLAVGPVPMMRAVARITDPLASRPMVSLNSIMVDGTGMCGGCRVLLGDKSKFACVDGPNSTPPWSTSRSSCSATPCIATRKCQSLKHFEEHKDERTDAASRRAGRRGEALCLRATRFHLKSETFFL